MKLQLPLLTSVFLVSATVGCGQPAATESCQLDGDCEQGGVVGSCIEGYCAFEDPDCVNGKWAQGPSKGECIPEEGDAASDGVDTETQGESIGDEDGAETEDTGEETGTDPDLPAEDECANEVVVEGTTFTSLSTLDLEAVGIQAAPQSLAAARVAVVDGAQLRVLEYDTDAGEVGFIASVDLPAQAVVEPELEAADLFEDGWVDFAVVGEGTLHFVRANGADDYEAFALGAGGNSPFEHVSLIAGQGRNFITAHDSLGVMSVFLDLDTTPILQDPPLSDDFDPTDVKGFISDASLVGAMVAEASTLSAMFRPVLLSNVCCSPWNESIDLDAQIDRLFASASPSHVYIQLVNGDLLTTDLAGLLAPTPIVAPTDLQAVTVLALDDEFEPTQSLAAVTESGLWISQPLPAAGEPTPDNTLCLDEPLVELAAARSTDGDVLLVGRTEAGALEVFLGAQD